MIRTRRERELMDRLKVGHRLFLNHGYKCFKDKDGRLILLYNRDNLTLSGKYIGNQDIVISIEKDALCTFQYEITNIENVTSKDGSYNLYELKSRDEAYNETLYLRLSEDNNSFPVEYITPQFILEDKWNNEFTPIEDLERYGENFSIIGLKYNKEISYKDKFTVRKNKFTETLLSIDSIDKENKEVYLRIVTNFPDAYITKDDIKNNIYRYHDEL